MYGRTRRRKVKKGETHTKARKQRGGMSQPGVFQSTTHAVGSNKLTFLERLKRGFSSVPRSLESSTKRFYRALGMNGGSPCGYMGGKSYGKKTQKKHYRRRRKH